MIDPNKTLGFQHSRTSLKRGYKHMDLFQRSSLKYALVVTIKHNPYWSAFLHFYILTGAISSATNEDHLAGIQKILFILNKRIGSLCILVRENIVSKFMLHDSMVGVEYIKYFCLDGQLQENKRRTVRGVCNTIFSEYMKQRTNILK